mmetsp:Transcript_22483/g.60817  ORF Transcript_22483/g.60817 Transcript_22483/m.60817 type:complete len:204 (-) Transcript_22483:1273-1884(-)
MPERAPQDRRCRGQLSTPHRDGPQLHARASALHEPAVREPPRSWRIHCSAAHPLRRHLSPAVPRWTPALGREGARGHDAPRPRHRRARHAGSERHRVTRLGPRVGPLPLQLNARRGSLRGGRRRNPAHLDEPWAQGCEKPAQGRRLVGGVRPRGPRVHGCGGEWRSNAGGSLRHQAVDDGERARHGHPHLMVRIRQLVCHPSA